MAIKRAIRATFFTTALSLSFGDPATEALFTATCKQLQICQWVEAQAQQQRPAWSRNPFVEKAFLVIDSLHRKQLYLSLTF